jgi:Ca2+-binding RTX toxin-like protein
MFDQFFFGEASRDKFVGGEGNDFIDGGAGKDILAGGLGDDKILGGAGNDLLRGDLNRRSPQNNINGGNDIVVTPKIRTGLRERKLESNKGKEYGQQTKKLQ